MQSRLREGGEGFIDNVDRVAAVDAVGGPGKGDVVVVVEVLEVAGPVIKFENHGGAGAEAGRGHSSTAAAGRERGVLGAENHDAHPVGGPADGAIAQLDGDFHLDVVVEVAFGTEDRSSAGVGRGRDEDVASELLEVQLQLVLDDLLGIDGTGKGWSEQRGVRSSSGS